MAVYINLDRRTDRRADFEAECSRMGIRVERFPAIVHPLGGALGCSASHLQVLKLARERGYPSVMVFEDDFEFLISNEEFAAVLASLPEDYDVVMLGYNLCRGDDYTPQFGRTLEAQTTSGYIVHQKAYDGLISVWEEGLRRYEENPTHHWLYICDQSWKPLQPLLRWYHTRPRVGKQRAGWSDLGQKFVDYDT
jgi:hypothetical protein